jgi:aminoglycoside phosphotransferase (APT) family kinase protein
MRPGGAGRRQALEPFLPALEPFLGPEEVDRLVDLLAHSARVAIPSARWFVKARTRGDPHGLSALRHELRFLQTCPGLPVRVPALRSHYVSDDLVILLFDRLDAVPLAEKRNAFRLREGAQVDAILEDVLHLQNVNPPGSLRPEYERGSRLGKYLPVIARELESDTLSFLEDASRSWTTAAKLVLSHGDLLPANILLDRGGSYWLVDWEYASLRPPSYDPALFLLFSRPPVEGIELLESLASRWDRQDLYRDAVVIAAREIKNWMTQVPPGPSQVAHIELWRQALRGAIRHIGRC